MKKTILTSTIVTAFSLLSLEAAMAEEKNTIYGSENSSNGVYNKEDDIIRVHKGICSNCPAKTGNNRQGENPSPPQGDSNKIKEGKDVPKNN